MSRMIFVRVVRIFVISFIFIAFISAVSAEENDFFDLLNDPLVTEIKLETDLSTTQSFILSKEIDLNGHTWTISGGKVTLSAIVKGKTKKIYVTGGTVLAESAPQCPVDINGGVMRKRTNLTVDCPDGYIDSIKYGYDSEQLDVETEYVKGKRITGGHVSLLLKTDITGKVDVSRITVEGEIYRTGKQNKTIYSKINEIQYVVDGVVRKGEPSTYTQYDGELELPIVKKKGYTFVGWSENGVDNPIQTLEASQQQNRNLILTALFEEGEEQTGKQDGWGNGSSGRFSGRGGSGMILAETAEEEDDELSSGGRGEDKNGGSAEASTQQANNNGGQRRRVSVASNKTKTTFEEKGPRSEDVGVTIERDKMDRFGPMIAGGVLILLAIVLMVVLHYLSRKNKRHF